MVKRQGKAILALMDKAIITNNPDVSFQYCTALNTATLLPTNQQLKQEC